jgi:hypothetical protein
MTDVSHFQLIKTRVYTGNESGMIRTQLDRTDQFGNGDGYLDENEANAFIASYNDYFKPTESIIMDESYVIKQNASVLAFNLVGSTSDSTSTITTRFTFDAKPISIPSQRQYYLQFKDDLWTYSDLLGNKQPTMDNNVTIRAPEGWHIAYTAGLNNETYEEDKRIMKANANLDFQSISVKISTEAEEDINENSGFLSTDLINNIAIIGVILAIIVILALVKIYRPGRTSDTAVPITDAEKDELLSMRKELQENLLTVRGDLISDKITKDEARIKEKTIKEQIREVDKKLSAARVQKKDGK